MASGVNIRQLLVEKYRPASLDTYVFQNESTEKLIRKWVEDGEYPNVLLSGDPGCGKCLGRDELISVRIDTTNLSEEAIEQLMERSL